MRWPGKEKSGSECEVPVHAVDFFPTFAALAGAALPADHSLDGENLLPLLTQTDPLQRTSLFWHMPTYTTNYSRTPCAVIREGDWKLIHWFGDYLDTAGFTPDDKPYGKLVVGPRTELYHLRDDLGESKDLADDRPKKTAHLTKSLHAWLRPFAKKICRKDRVKIFRGKA